MAGATGLDAGELAGVAILKWIEVCPSQSLSSPAAPACLPQAGRWVPRAETRRRSRRLLRRSVIVKYIRQFGRGALPPPDSLYGLTANTQSKNTPIVRWRVASTGCSNRNRYATQRLSSAKTKRKKRNHPPGHGGGDWPRRSILPKHAPHSDDYFLRHSRLLKHTLTGFTRQGFCGL